MEEKEDKGVSVEFKFIPDGRTDDVTEVKEESSKVEVKEEKPKIEVKKARPKPKVVTVSKTFFDFTYECSHGGTGHCVECYNKAKG